VHQICMYSALIFSVLGTVLIVIEKGIVPLEQGVLHAILGTTTLCLAFLQPIMAMMRCAPDHHLRPVFNWAHRIVGISVLVLGWLTVFWVTEFSTPVVSDIFEYLTYFVLAWVIVSHGTVIMYKNVKAGEVVKTLEDDRTLNILGMVYAMVLTFSVIALIIFVIIGV